MLEKLNQIYEIDDLSVWETTTRKIGTGFEIVPCDLETTDVEEYSKKLTQFIRSLNPNLIARIEFQSIESFDKIGGSRASAIVSLGYRKNKFLLYINHLPNIFNLSEIKSMLYKQKDAVSDFSMLLKIKTDLKNCGFDVIPLSKQSIQKLFNHDFDIVPTVKSLESETGSIGVLRLTKLSHQDVNFESLNKCLMKLNNFKLSVSFKKLPQVTSKIFLEKRLKQLTASHDTTTDLQKSETLEALQNQFASGASLLEFEFLLEFRRSTQAELINALKLSQSILNHFAEFKIETYGLLPSYVAMKPESNQHVTSFENDESICGLLPLFVKNDTEAKISEKSLTLFREDHTLSHFDLFDDKYNCFNTLIVGSSGKGKSVLTGMLTRSLLNDPKVSVIKIDVGGSHSKECELFNGTEYKISLNQPSGLNPFSVLSTSATDSEKISILSKFLSVLILETGEISFSKELRSEIEESVQQYVLTLPKNPSLNDFYNKMQKVFPRPQLLKRWVAGGIYESAFSVSNEYKILSNTVSDSLSNTVSLNLGEAVRLRYFNFSQVFDASDPEFAQATIAAVLAQFNTDCITEKDRRLVLLCDEVPFFIKICFDFFKFSTANVRKYGHAVVITTQSSHQLVVNGDHGIIDNSPQRFLFNIDGKQNEFKDLLELTQNQLQTISDLNSVPGKYSEVFLHEKKLTGKKLKIVITPEEYWSLTTSYLDQQKIKKIREFIPELSLRETLKCLSLA